MTSIKKIVNIINRFLLKKIKVNFTFLNFVNKKNLFQRLKNRKSLNTFPPDERVWTLSN